MRVKLSTIFTVLLGVTLVAAGLVPLFVSEPVTRNGVWLGMSIAAFTGLIAFGGLAWAWTRGPQKLFGALVAGMLVRMLVLGLGLASTRLLPGVSPLPVAAGFFILYMIHQVLEITFLLKGSRPPENRVT